MVLMTSSENYCKIALMQISASRANGSHIQHPHVHNVSEWRIYAYRSWKILSSDVRTTRVHATKDDEFKPGPPFNYMPLAEWFDLGPRTSELYS